MESEHDERKQTEEAQQAGKEMPETKEAPPTRKTGFSRGKVFLGLVVGAVVVLGIYMSLQRSPSTSAIGSAATSASFTLVTSDRTDVDCVAAKAIQGFHCGFSSETTPWQGDEQIKLKPYYTVDRHLYLVPGLFLQPTILNRFQWEHPDKPREQLKRFTARCQIKAIGKLAGVRTHWLAGSAWSNPEEVEVGTVSDCKVEG